jgi:hypothetical protein
LAGISTATATPLNPERKNMTFQPGKDTSLAQSTVLKPGSASRWGRTPLWTGGKVQKITSNPQTPAQVEVGGIAFRKTGEAVTQAVTPKPVVQSAGGGR